MGLDHVVSLEGSDVVLGPYLDAHVVEIQRVRDYGAEDVLEHHVVGLAIYQTNAFKFGLYKR